MFFVIFSQFNSNKKTLLLWQLLYVFWWSMMHIDQFWAFRRKCAILACKSSIYSKKTSLGKFKHILMYSDAYWHNDTRKLCGNNSKNVLKSIILKIYLNTCIYAVGKVIEKI